MAQTFLQDALLRMMGRRREDEAMAQAAKQRDAAMASQVMGQGVDALQNVQRMNLQTQQADLDREDARQRLAAQMAHQMGLSEAQDARAAARDEANQNRWDARLKQERELAEGRNQTSKEVAKIRAYAPPRPRVGGVSSSADPMKMLVDIDKKIASLQNDAAKGYYRPAEMQQLLETRKQVAAMVEQRKGGTVFSPKPPPSGDPGDIPINAR